MEVKIDHRTAVPIGWVFSGLAFMLSIITIGAFWVSAVDFRLMRIEEKLGIPAIRGAFVGAPVDSVFAGEGRHDDTKRLSKSLGDMQSH